MMFARLLGTRLTSVLTTSALVAAGLAVTVAAAPVAAADVSSLVTPSAQTVTADPLPTVQIDGVAWDQAVVGNTVYVGGKFTNARPAGAAPKTQLTTRNNLLAYDITTGNLITSFAPSLNNQVKVVAASPDGTRIYVGGSFTTADGANRYRIAAYNTATGALVANFAPSIDYTVNAIVATNTTVYVGGEFSKVGSAARSKLAAFSASNGALLAWAPPADGTVNALTLTPGNTLVVGGAFQNVNSSPAYGMAKLDMTTGALIPWNTTNLIRNAGSQSAILSLSTDAGTVYGTGYTFGDGGNFEGTFAADAATGDIKWVEDCHGDTYDSYAGAGAVYTVSHAHYCSTVGGFPQSNPWTINMRHALAFTTDATGTAAHNEWGGYYDYYGTPTPSMINWFPDLEVGSFTGKQQAAWSVTGNSKYVVLGGEFPTVNGISQQGLVRFAVAGTAPSKVGPTYSGINFTPTINALPAGARIAWQANTDRDDLTLTYKLTRNGTVVYTTTDSSPYWNRKTMGYIDATVTPGATYTYRLSATDSAGNVVQSNNVSYRVPPAGSFSAYTQRVLADGASPYWPMNEASGTALVDNSGFNDADTTAALTRSVTPGAIAGDTASSFDGSTSASTRTAITAPNTFTAQAWIKTTTTSGGKIIGFGNTRSGGSNSYDRHVYMDNDGRIWFGVYTGNTQTLNSNPGYNDGQWHQITASMGAGGMTLSIDGKQIGQRADTTTGQPFDGYWRVGGDSLGGWPYQPSSPNFAGSIDEVAVYPTVLTRQQIDAQWVASGRTSTIPAAPSDPYGAAVFNDNPLLFWRLGDTAGTTAKDSGPNGDRTGIYQNGVTLGAAGGIKGTSDTAASFDGSDDFVASTNQFANPRTYSEEAWFKTTSTNGGKIIGFGRSQTGTSGSYDRHIYMSPSGIVTYGIYDGNLNTISTSTPLNDGVWHQVVATQSSVDGMKFYVDGVLVGSNPNTSPEGYDGYWRVGGDNHWGGGSAFVNGTIDDAAVYNTALTAAQVANHFSLGSTVVPANQAPVAGFSSAANSLDATFTSSSTDPDGSIASYSWNFGDSTTSTDVNPRHTYAAAGTYTVTLVVTDDKGLTNTVTNPITVTAAPVNQAPVASFTVTPAQLTANVDAAGSTDPDGTIASYAWDFGDGATATGVTASHAYGTAGSKTITLTVTDNLGKTATSSQPVQVVAPPVNHAPVASFTVATDGLTANVESTSTDPDATDAIASYAWTFGDGGSATTKAVVHPYASAGAYPVTLTVTDGNGASASVTQSVTVAAPPPNNVPPVADFTSTVNGLTANVSSAATDADGTVVAFSWNFGDGGTDLATTPTASHPYAAAGQYDVTLTVTDDHGATSAVTKKVSVTAPVVTPLVTDTFSRVIANGLGTADTGGAWTVTGGAANFAVNGGSAKFKLTGPGFGTTALLGAVSTADTDTTLTMSLDKPATGGGTYLSVAARKVGNSEYRVTTRFTSTGGVNVTIIKVTNGVSTTLSSVNLPNVTVAPGETLSVRMQVTGSAQATIKAKAWKSASTEPAAWTATATDASAPLTAAGGVALYPYQSGSSAAGQVVLSVDDLKVVSVP